MDYSAIHNDSEHPAGSSPWGSPRADRTTFGASGSQDVASSPSPSQPHASDSPRAPYSRDDDGRGSPDLSERLQSPQLGDPDYAIEQPPYASQQSQQQQQQYNQQGRSPLPARYQTGARQHARQPAPVYKIQAKVTGLERTGKKDPILRFDVHVRFIRLFSFGSYCTRTDACNDRPIFPNFARLSIVTFAGLTQSSSSWRII